MKKLSIRILKYFLSLLEDKKVVKRKLPELLDAGEEDIVGGRPEHRP